MSKKDKSLPKKNSDLFGYDYEQSKDTRNVHETGKKSFKNSEKLRIYYIQEKKDRQKNEQKSSSLNIFNTKINVEKKNK